MPAGADDRRPPRWLALVTVMAGVSLVGLSGSLIKDALREDAPVLDILRRTLADLPGGDLPTKPVPIEDLPTKPVPIEEPAVTKVLLGIFFILFAQVLYVTHLRKGKARG
jgi:hypothetical protein